MRRVGAKRGVLAGSGLSRTRIRIWTPTKYDSRLAAFALGACAVETEVEPICLVRRGEEDGDEPARLA